MEAAIVEAWLGFSPATKEKVRSANSEAHAIIIFLCAVFPLCKAVNLSSVTSATP